MYYYLGLVTDADMKRGRLKPSYVLGSFDSVSPLRAPWRVVKMGGRLERQPRVLATSLFGNDLMIDFMSYWRAMVPRKRASQRTKKSKRRRVYVHGALFFFECDRYGNPTGMKVFIKRVPDRQKRLQDDNLQRYNAAAENIKTMSSVLSAAPMFDILSTTGIRPRLIQNTVKSVLHKEQHKNYEKEKRKDGNERSYVLAGRRPVQHPPNRQRQ